MSGEAAFDIYGPIEDDSYWKECQIEIEKLPKNVTVNYCGLVSHDAVHEIFSKYDAFLFPTFSENYGHVIAEALAVGTPVIISDQTPWNDINDANAGWALPLENEEAFTSAIQEIIGCNHNNYFNSAKKYAKEKMKLESIRQEYETVLKSVHNNEDE